MGPGIAAPVAAPAVSWLSRFGPSIVSGIGSLLGGRAGNVASAREAQRNREFQLMMSNTAHQREVKDLLAAGLNPILSANKGASTASGSMAPQHDVATPAIHSAQAARRLAADLELIKAQSDKTFHEARNASNIADISTPPAIVARTVSTAGNAAVDKANKTDFPGMWESLKEGVRTGGRGIRKALISKPQEAIQWLMDQTQRLNQGENKIPLDNSARQSQEMTREEIERYNREVERLTKGDKHKVEAMRLRQKAAQEYEEQQQRKLNRRRRDY